MRNPVLHFGPKPDTVQRALAHLITIEAEAIANGGWYGSDLFAFLALVLAYYQECGTSLQQMVDLPLQEQMAHSTIRAEKLLADVKRQIEKRPNPENLI